MQQENRILNNRVAQQSAELKMLRREFDLVSRSINAAFEEDFTWQILGAENRKMDILMNLTLRMKILAKNVT